MIKGLGVAQEWRPRRLEWVSRADADRLSGADADRLSGAVPGVPRRSPEGT